MWRVGIDLHRETVVIAAVNETGEVVKPVSVRCEDTATIVNVVKALGSFRAVIEASATYRWLYGLLQPYGTILLAHPFRLRAMVQRRTKTDKLDAQLLANLLRINQIPPAYIPPEPYQQLRDLTRRRARPGRESAQAKIHLRACWPDRIAKHPIESLLGCAAWLGSAGKTSAGSRIWSATKCSRD
jgi:transposase